MSHDRDHLQTGQRVASNIRSVSSKSFDFQIELQSCISVEEYVSDRWRNTAVNLVEDPLDGWFASGSWRNYAHCLLASTHAWSLQMSIHCAGRCRGRSGVASTLQTMQRNSSLPALWRALSMGGLRTVLVNIPPQPCSSQSGSTGPHKAMARRMWLCGRRYDSFRHLVFFCGVVSTVDLMDFPDFEHDRVLVQCMPGEVQCVVWRSRLPCSACRDRETSNGASNPPHTRACCSQPQLTHVCEHSQGQSGMLM